VWEPSRGVVQKLRRAVPYIVVVDVDSVDLFKTRLDKFWTFQDVKYDYTVDVTGTGDRSEFDTENY